MHGAVEDGPQCLICQEPLLQEVPCALSCGHVYHTTCCQQWFRRKQDKKSLLGECPSCKQKSGLDDLLLLEFEVASVQLEEARRLEASSQEQRLLLREELACASEDACGWLQLAEQRLKERQELVQELRQARKSLELQSPQLENNLVQLCADREQRLLSNASLGAQVDQQNSRQRSSRGLGRSQDTVNEDDADAKQERQKLRHVRPADRARQLHEAVVSARHQESEITKASREREEATEELEQELAQCKRLEAQLRGDVMLLKGGEEPAEQEQRAPKRPRQAPPPSRRTALPKQQEDVAEEDLLYSGAPVRRGASVLQASAKLPSASASSAAAAPSVPDMDDLFTPCRKPSALQTLFKRRS